MLRGDTFDLKYFIGAVSHPVGTFYRAWFRWLLIYNPILKVLKYYIIIENTQIYISSTPGSK